MVSACSVDWNGARSLGRVCIFRRWRDPAWTQTAPGSIHGMPICQAWCWNIYLQNWVIIVVNIPYMEYNHPNNPNNIPYIWVYSLSIHGIFHIGWLFGYVNIPAPWSTWECDEDHTATTAAHRCKAAQQAPEGWCKAHVATCWSFDLSKI